MPRTAIFQARDFQPSRKPSPRSDGRELVVFESLVALLALLLIMSGFSLYVGQALNAPNETMSSSVVSTQTTAEIPLSLVEA